MSGTDRPVALTVAGSDSGGGAGIQADLKTMEATGAFGTSAVTSVTAQNTRGVAAVEHVSPDVVAAQIRAVTDDFDVGAAKTGMLGTAPIVATVADALADSEFPVVVDPVMVAQSGDRLLDADAEDALRADLLPAAALATPNWPEAGVLAGMDVEDVADARSAAEAILEWGPEAVLVTGGHTGTDDVVDVLATGGEVTTFRSDRYGTGNTHGSGCTVSAATAAALAGGLSLADAVARAQTVIDRAVRYAHDLGGGAGPVHHLAELRNDAARFEVVGEVRSAVGALVRRDVSRLVPEVGMNLAVATPYAMDRSEVAAVEGRIHRTREGVRATGPAWLDASSHLARLLGAARRHDPAVRAVANVRVDDDVVDAVETHFDARSVDRTAEPDASATEERDGGTMSWTVERVMADRDRVPEAVYDRGALGKEPMCRLFGSDGRAVREMITTLDEALGESA